MNTIPVSQIVKINPAVIGGGGNPLSLNGVILSDSELIPAGKTISFSTADAVKDFFGITSVESDLADVYFQGFSIATTLPGTLIFAPYAADDRPAWIKSAQGLTLAAVNAITPGTLTITIDGTARTTASIDLSSATSLSAAAATIQSAIIAAGATGASVVWNSTQGVFIITSPTDGSESSIGYASGALASALKLTLPTGASISNGADADTPETSMENVINNTRNWASFTTTFEPDADGKDEFSAWANAQNKRFLYICWDTDANAITQNASDTAAARAAALNYTGVTFVSGSAAFCEEEGSTLEESARKVAVFILGTIASIDFARKNGRITLAFKTQDGIPRTCGDHQQADNLLANGYNYMGAYATAADEFNFLYNGQMSGDWKWIDPFVNQIFMNSQFELYIITLMLAMNSIPYNEDGYSALAATLSDPIEQAHTNGSIRKGVSISNQQAAILKAAAGTDIKSDLENEGHFLQIIDPGAQARALRASPIVNFWYTDGGSIHQITMASINIL